MYKGGPKCHLHLCLANLGSIFGKKAHVQIDLKPNDLNDPIKCRENPLKLFNNGLHLKNDPHRVDMKLPKVCQLYHSIGNFSC